MFNSKIGRQVRKLDFLIRTTGFHPSSYLQVFYSKVENFLAIPWKFLLLLFLAEQWGLFLNMHSLSFPFAFPYGNCKAVIRNRWI